MFCRPKPFPPYPSHHYHSQFRLEIDREKERLKRRQEKNREVCDETKKCGIEKFIRFPFNRFLIDERMKSWHWTRWGGAKKKRCSRHNLKRGVTLFLLSLLFPTLFVHSSASSSFFSRYSWDLFYFIDVKMKTRNVNNLENIFSLGKILHHRHLHPLMLALSHATTPIRDGRNDPSKSNQILFR